MISDEIERVRMPGRVGEEIAGVLSIDADGDELIVDGGFTTVDDEGCAGDCENRR